MSQQPMRIVLIGVENLWNNHLSPEERQLLLQDLQGVIDKFYRLKFQQFQMPLDAVNGLLNDAINRRAETNESDANSDGVARIEHSGDSAVDQQNSNN